MDNNYNRMMSMAESATKLELFISCRSLVNMDFLSKSDPYVVVSLKKNNNWIEFGRTETIQDNLNPNFTKTFLMDFYFEVQQHLKFAVYDYDGPNSSEFIGECFTSIGAIAGAKDQILVLNLSQKGGKLIVRADSVQQVNDQIDFNIRGEEIVDTRFWFWHTTSPFLRFYRCWKDGGQPLLVYENEPVMNSVRPYWKPVKLSAQKLCNGDYNMQIKIELWDYRANGTHVYCGETSVSVDELRKKSITNLNLTQKQQKKNVGKLIIEKFQLTTLPNFLDYIAGGLQLNLVVAIDFTASNQNPHHPTSLHYMNPNAPNQYQQAILSVCDILLNYDNDKMIPVYGFGCKTRLKNLVSNTTLHCFPLNGNIQNPEVYGIEGIMNTYCQALPNLQLDGPTYINPIIQQSLGFAKQSKLQNNQSYYILLIMTDGEIFDMQQTINSIIEASNLPISIIIIGVGNADFDNMRRLDNDDGSLRDDNNRAATRDCVQFVPFNEFKGNSELLAKNVLEELPQSIVEYMLKIGQAPQARNKINIQNFEVNQIVPPHQAQYQQQPLQYQGLIQPQAQFSAQVQYPSQGQFVPQAQYPPLQAQYPHPSDQSYHPQVTTQIYNQQPQYQYPPVQQQNQGVPYYQQSQQNNNNGNQPYFGGM